VTTQEIVEQNAFRAGYVVTDYFEIALPVYRVVLQASTLIKKKISALEEFVMRSVNAGLNTPAEAAAFLGLDEVVVRLILGRLVQDTSVALVGVPSDSSQMLKLTSKGMKTLETAEAIVPEERSLQLYFDALLRKPAWFRERLLKFRQINEEGLIEIASVPARQPDIRDFPPSEVGRILRQFGGATLERREILSVQRVERCTRFFRPAVAIVYKSLGGGDLRVELAVDGRITNEYAVAFARAGGRKLLGLDDQAPQPAQEIQAYSLPEQTGQTKLEPAHGVEIELIRTRTELLETTQLVQTAREKEKLELQQRLNELQLKITQLEGERAQRRVRQVYVYEHAGLLDRAITHCLRRLLIIAPWINSQVVDDDLLLKLKSALQRGVIVHIGYGISKHPDRKNDKEAESKLVRLSGEYKNFTFVRLGNTHAKVLICDSLFIVTGSFNWFSFRGDPTRTYRDEQSTLVEIPEHIDEVYSEQVKRFQSEADEGSLN
jgi:hypothetical protein